MKKLFFLLMLLVAFTSGAQEKSQDSTFSAFGRAILRAKSADAFRKSDVKQEEFNETIYQQLSKDEQNQNIEKSYNYFEILKVRSMLQQKKVFSVIIDPKERGTTLPDTQQPISEAKGDSISVAKKEFHSNRIFGPTQYDSRIEPLQLSGEVEWQKKIIDNSESVAIIIEREKITQITATIYQLDIATKLGSRFGLCKDEAFFNQPVTGVGTAFVFSETTMLTANHVFERPLKHYVVVFGLKILNKQGVVDVFVNKGNIFYPKEIVKRDWNLDVVEFRLDRTINRPLLPLANSKDIRVAESEVYMIGYPSGLPMKIAMNASITENDNPQFYYTSLDCFQGNSGSPVFDFYTHKVIGLLVSGEVDYQFNGNCFESPLCKYPYCKGEKVIRMEVIMNQL